MLGLNLWDAIDPEQAGYTIPAQPAPSPVAVPAQAQPGGIGGLLSSLFGGQRQPTQGFEGIPQREAPTWREKISTILSPALMQIGAALMSPPAQRAAILGLPLYVPSRQTLADDRAYRAQLAAWQKVNTQQARSPSEIELFLANPDLYKEYKGIQKPEKEQKQYRAYTIGTDGKPNLVYEGKEQPTIHNIPREPEKPVHVVIPYGTDMSKVNLPPNTIPHLEPPPQKQQAVWHPTTMVNEKGETVPAKMHSITGEVVPTGIINQVGKASPGKKSRLFQQQTIIPGIPPEAGGTLQSGGIAPAPAGQATFPTSGQPTPIGTTPDGKTVYQDAQGKKFIQR